MWSFENKNANNVNFKKCLNSGTIVVYTTWLTWCRFLRKYDYSTAVEYVMIYYIIMIAYNIAVVEQNWPNKVDNIDTKKNSGWFSNIFFMRVGCIVCLFSR